MKFNILKTLLIISLTIAIYSLQTESMTSTHTSSKTNAKTSIFSFDFLSVMKNKIDFKRRADRSKSNGNNKSTKLQPPGAAAAPAATKNPTNPGEVTNNEDEELPLPDGVFYHGWIKYFKYNEFDAKNKRPSSFFKNNEFYEQLKEGGNEETEAEKIKHKANWWGVLHGKSFNILGNKYISSKVFDVLQLETIPPIPEDKKDSYGDGIIDFGSFSEGSCFKVLSNTRQTWIICVNSNEEKLKLMKAIKEQVIRLQRERGDIVTVVKPIPDSVARNLGNSSHEIKKEKREVTDGYWIVLQNWSQCSKKCDGGVSTLHRLCVPPKNGGKPCDGKGVETKACNTKPCPSVNSKEAEDKMKPVTLKPIVKVMPYSSRPQRYHKCIIKEADLMMVNTTSGYGSLQIPVRGVLNNRTISFYEDADNYSSNFVSYNLKTSTFERSQTDKNCFVIKENRKRSELCPLGEKNSKTFDEWADDFDLFKNKCETKIDEMEDFIKKKLAEKMKAAKENVLAEREALINQRMRKDKENKDLNIVKQTNKVAQQAIVRENDLEDLIEKEEKEREAKEEHDILLQIEDEKKKNECIMKALKEKELENLKRQGNIETEQQINAIKKQAIQEVEQKRNKLKEKIAEMRKKARRNQGRLKQRLMTMRMTVAKQLNDRYKIGDQNKCVQAMKNDNERLKYCQANFDEISTFGACKDEDDFCTLCCEHEYGEMHPDRRNKCFREVCQPAKESAAKAGHWIWSNEFSK